MLNFIEYPKCSTCKKAKKYLDQLGLEHQDRHIVEEKLNKEELHALYKKSNLPLKKFFNTSGLKYRELNLKDKLPDLTLEGYKVALERDIKKIGYKLKKVLSGLSRIIMTILPIRKKTYLTIDNAKWSVYQASAMMCITYDLARYVFDKLNDKRIINYFKYSFAPDEMVIPTIIFNSPYRVNCSLYEKDSYDGLKSLSAITYFNYGKEIQTFTIENYEELKHSDKMFARKFATGISDSLMDKFDKEHGL